jgi:hypothetical protein
MPVLTSSSCACDRDGDTFVTSANQLIDITCAGVDTLYVHTLAINEVAQQFYAKHGFVAEQEESSNEAHNR